jgi:hypothetical protein
MVGSLDKCDLITLKCDLKKKMKILQPNLIGGEKVYSYSSRMLEKGVKKVK